MCHYNVFWGNPHTNADMKAEMQRLWILKIPGIITNILLTISCNVVENLFYLYMVHLMTLLTYQNTEKQVKLQLSLYLHYMEA